MLICARSARQWRTQWLAVAVVVFLGNAWGGLAVAQDIVRVEEDWELVLKDPDPDLTAPQITCSISPTADVDGLHATFELNHQSYPFFASGGMRLQLWNGDANVSSHKAHNDAVMSTPGERVSWTQVMNLSGDTLTFQVIDGTSTTWDDFGGEGCLKSTQATSLANLNGYNPAVSVANSGAGYASNRIVQMKLKRVRLTLSTGVEVVDETERVVEQQTE